jgi:protein arginine kinase
MLKTSLAKPGAWIASTGPDQDVVLNTQGTLARNLADLPFPARCSEDEKRTVQERVTQAFEAAGLLATGSYIELTDLHVREVRMLVERRLITRHLIESRGPRGVYIANDQSMSVMVNERDHIRITAMARGLQPQEMWNVLNRVDDALHIPLDYAYHEKHGFLTSALYEVGTGLKLHVKLHLPALASSGPISDVIDSAHVDHHDFEGEYGPMATAPGDLFALANRSTLGSSEGEIDFHLRAFTGKLMQQERDARTAMAGAGHSLADRVGRALGVARGARMLEWEEALTLLSHLRLGVATGQLDSVSYASIDELQVIAQPAHLECRLGSASDDLAINAARADLFRERFS